MNEFRSITYPPLFWIIFCNLSGSLLIQIRFVWFSAKEVFPKRFQLIFFRKLFIIQSIFAEKENYGNHLVQGLVKMVGWVEQSNLNQNCSLSWFLLNVALCYLDEPQRVRGVFIDFHVHLSYLFQVVADYGLGGAECYLLSTFLRIAFHQSSKSTLVDVRWASCSGLSLNDASSEQNLKNSFQLGGQ